MPLYIRDDRVKELAGQVAALQRPTVTDAVRDALARRLSSCRTSVTSGGAWSTSYWRGSTPSPICAGLYRQGSLRRERGPDRLTIVVDTSALVAILFAEPERDRFRGLLQTTPAVISAGSLIELLRVVMRRTPKLLAEARTLLRVLDVATAAVDEAQVALAMEGQARFGIGRGRPPAVLNFGDLFAYALARQLDAPLLFKGRGFSRTDLRRAL